MITSILMMNDSMVTFLMVLELIKRTREKRLERNQIRAIPRIIFDLEVKQLSTLDIVFGYENDWISK